MVIYTPSSPIAKFIPNGVDVSGPFGFQIFVLLGKKSLKVFDVPLVSKEVMLCFFIDCKFLDKLFFSSLKLKENVVEKKRIEFNL